VRAAEWPTVARVDAQPLIAQAARLDAALESLGQPLPAATRKAPAALAAADGADAVSAVQKLLDPHCLAAVEIDEKGVARVVPAANKLALVEQGWRAYLVKVINTPGATGDAARRQPERPPTAVLAQGPIDKRWLACCRTPRSPCCRTSAASASSTPWCRSSAATPARRPPTSPSGWKGARVEDGAGSGRPRVALRQGTDGWGDAKNCKLEAVKGTLKVTMTAEDPYFSTK
jgi:hypothetical protein